jgi:hypothetical protein
MVALLYRKWLCLATVDKDERVYTIRACIALVDISVEDVDNGRGRLNGSDQHLTPDR